MKPHTRIGLAAAALAVAIAPLTGAQEAPRPDSSGYVTAKRRELLVRNPRQR